MTKGFNTSMWLSTIWKEVLEIKEGRSAPLAENDQRSLLMDALIYGIKLGMRDIFLKQEKVGGAM
jgi:hypothetical protein